MVTETPFLVEKHKHRIVKLDGYWKLYCPRRGGDSLILARKFDDIIKAYNTPCFYDNNMSHLLPVAVRVNEH